MTVAATAQNLQIVPSDRALGADVVGLDLAGELTAAQVEQVRQAWATHLVLRFRGYQNLPLERLAAFSRYFGQLDAAPVASQRMGDDFAWHHPDITVISNVTVNGKPVGDLGASEAVWHADMTYNERPPMGSCLYAVEIPPEGGNTEFLNMYEAYDTLPADLKRRAHTLHCVHDASHNSAGELRKGYVDNADPSKTVGAVHPLVREHPVTGRPCLFLGRRRNAHLVGMPVPESEALLDEFWAHATQRRFVWTQVWQLGDIVMWDNRCTMHRRDAFDASSRRLMYRTQIAGDAVRAARA